MSLAAQELAEQPNRQSEIFQSGIQTAISVIGFCRILNFGGVVHTLSTLTR